MANKQGFDSEVIVRWVVHAGPDREMRLEKGLTYTDSAGKKWPAEPGDLIDGASIPRFLWSTFPGSPFIGDYRRAAALHDSNYIHRYGGDRKAVDRVFYEAMRFDGTSRFKSLAMYIAVRLFGGRYWQKNEFVATTPRMEQECWELVEWANVAPGEPDLDAIDKRCDKLRADLNLNLAE